MGIGSHPFLGKPKSGPLALSSVLSLSELRGTRFYSIMFGQEMADPRCVGANEGIKIRDTSSSFDLFYGLRGAAEREKSKFLEIYGDFGSNPTLAEISALLREDGVVLNVSIGLTAEMERQVAKILTAAFVARINRSPYNGYLLFKIAITSIIKVIPVPNRAVRVKVFSPVPEVVPPKAIRPLYNFSSEKVRDRKAGEHLPFEADAIYGTALYVYPSFFSDDNIDLLAQALYAMA